MATTKNLGLHVFEDGNEDAYNSMKELFGNDNSNMVKLDNAIGELKEAIPQSTTADVGKFVCINSEGKMSLVSIPRAEGGSF